MVDQINGNKINKYYIPGGIRNNVLNFNIGMMRVPRPRVLPPPLLLDRIPVSMLGKRTMPATQPKPKTNAGKSLMEYLKEKHNTQPVNMNKR